MESTQIFTSNNGKWLSSDEEKMPLVETALKGKGGEPLYPALCVGADEIYPDADGHPTLFTLHSPIDNKLLGCSGVADELLAENAISIAHDTFREWRVVPAPKRGELVRRFGEKVRQQKYELAKIITIEAGKTWQESVGEVQEVIDVCEFAVGLSRQLHGLTIVSERPLHRMMEQWHPLGVVGVISAFNFPMAVWAWNAALALVCGNTLVWKPSEKTPLCALACHRLLIASLQDMNMGHLKGVSVVLNGHHEVGELISKHDLLPLVSATGSIPMGRHVAECVARRLGRSLLELGGNNALIVSSQADLNMALKGVVFSAVGTSGQRCTSLRRLYLQDDIAEGFIQKLIATYSTIAVGDPRSEGNLCGPVIGEHVWYEMKKKLADVVERGGKLLVGGERLKEGVAKGGVYIAPAIVEVSFDDPCLQDETFAPLMFVIRYSELEDAIAWQNHVRQGLSSAIFTQNLQEAELFMSASGSDCGIANVNIGTSGAEIGGAFGGEKDTGGGRESGSDAWKQYMRRSTNTINYGSEIPLAQGIRFDL
ncbi:aldehyde dehydrogenase family protein [Gammaproteobacteria bacterium 45_16_T64]|nr:aldehyde dehydrogenase family protein [Gammaproteobacteria bacterium 45_16_T64]